MSISVLQFIGFDNKKKLELFFPSGKYLLIFLIDLFTLFFMRHKINQLVQLFQVCT